jgi:2-succinyl-5-enolpyruvyl-6-hydroxy-3-cyclohexene-1-carboxylate synthase
VPEGLHGFAAELLRLVRAYTALDDLEHYQTTRLSIPFRAAVVEAHQARVPLIACTADRPPELHHVGAPQTIEQAGLFAGALRWAFEPGVADARAMGWWRSLAARAVLESTAGPAGPGPVHLNLAFHEPLVAEPGDLPPGRPEGRPWHAAGRPGGVWDGDPALDASLSGRRGVIVAGAGSGPPAAVGELATRLAWPVLADPRSGCRGGACAVAAFDGLLRHHPFADTHSPDVVIRLGQPPASKALTGWLGRVQATQVVVDPYGQ